MPWKKPEDLKPQTKKAIETSSGNKSSSKKKKFIEIVNALMRGGMDEGKAIAIGLKRIKNEKV